LEFNFFLAVSALMCEVEICARWHVNPLAGDLDFEALAIFDRIGKPPQLLDELADWIVFFDVALPLVHVLCLHIPVQEMWQAISTPQGRDGLNFG
jgi:hypothetical protein